MRRITGHANPMCLTFQLEGIVAGPSVRLLEECWQSTLARPCKSVVRIYLTGMTFIDAAGKVYLADVHGQGAKVVCADCLTKAVVAAISKTPRWHGGGSRRDAKV